MITPDGKLAGIGSLIVGDADSGFPGNMFVAIDRLEPVIGDLIALGRPSLARLWGRGNAGVTVELTVNRQGEQHEIGVKTIDRYRYPKLSTTY